MLHNQDTGVTEVFRSTNFSILPIPEVWIAHRYLAGYQRFKNNIKQKIDMFGIVNQYQTVIDLIVGYRYEYFSVKAERGIKPIIILGTGGMAKIKSFSKVNMIGPWMIQYILGLGVQFYNGRILNEITLKYIQSKMTKGQAAFQLAFYWK